MKQARRNEMINVSHRIHNRKIDRRVARYVAKRSGLARVTDHKRNRYKTKKNKNYGKTNDNTHISTFSSLWRELAERIA